MANSVLYVVAASQGDYSDRREWSVCAYTQEALAKEHVERASAWARAAYAKHQEILYGNGDEEEVEIKSPFDEELSSAAYAEATYHVEQIELLDTVPGTAVPKVGEPIDENWGIF